MMTVYKAQATEQHFKLKPCTVKRKEGEGKEYEGCNMIEFLSYRFGTKLIIVVYGSGSKSVSLCLLSAWVCFLIKIISLSNVKLL